MNGIDFREEQEEKENIRKLNMVVSAVKKEYLKATNKFGAFYSAHEGYAVLLEEVNELWENVKLKPSLPARTSGMREEAIQVAAMAIRIVVDFGGV